MTRPAEELALGWRHIAYETSMLLFCTKALGDEEPTRSEQELNALFEAFAIHARALTSFLFVEADGEEEMVAAHFVRDPDAWRGERGELPPILSEVRQVLGHEVAALTYGRTEVGPVARGWRVQEMAAALGKTMAILLKHVDVDVTPPEDGPKA